MVDAPRVTDPTRTATQGWTETRVAVCYAVLLLAAGFWMVLAPHHAPGSINLLRNDEFDAASGWEASQGVVVRDGTALLGAQGPGDLTLTQTLAAPPGSSVRVVAHVSLSNVTRGPQRGNRRESNCSAAPVRDPGDGISTTRC